MDDLSITSLLSKYQHQKPKDFGDYQERQYPVSAVIEMIRELKGNNLPTTIMQLPPKQYAQELIEKYKPYMYPFASGSAYLTGELDDNVRLRDAKQCALIDVQNTIDYAKTFGDVTNTDIEYFNQVITELQNS